VVLVTSSDADPRSAAIAGGWPSGTNVAEAGERAQREPRRWLRHFRRFLVALDHVGLVLALLVFLASLTPSLLPRSWPAQGLVSGLGATASSR
jgi:uncharacterized membrane protein